MYRISQKCWNIHKLEIFEIILSNIFFSKNFSYSFINELLTKTLANHEALIDHIQIQTIYVKESILNIIIYLSFVT